MKDMSEKNFDVFISHSSKDALAASAIKQHLQGVGIRCWKAPDDIKPGESWPQAILRALGNCHAMVLVWSSNSTTSGEVSKELTLAMRNNITVVPFRIEDVKASGEWEYHLANTHWMDAFAGDMESYFSGLTSYLTRVLPVREPGANLVKDSDAGTSDQKDKAVSMTLFDALIESALQDGVISDEEMGVLVFRAETLGINKSELDLILKAKVDQNKKQAEEKQVVAEDRLFASQSASVKSLDTNPRPHASTLPPILPPVGEEKNVNSVTAIAVNKQLWLAYLLVVMFGIIGYCYTSVIRAVAVFALWIAAVLFLAVIAAIAGEESPLWDFTASVVIAVTPIFWLVIPLVAIKVWGFRRGLIPKGNS
jgi:hypothetical protein